MNQLKNYPQPNSTTNNSNLFTLKIDLSPVTISNFEKEFKI